MTGAPPGPLIWGPDAIMGALVGAGTFVYAGYVVPWLAHCLKRSFKVPVNIFNRSLNSVGQVLWGDVLEIVAVIPIV